MSGYFKIDHAIEECTLNLLEDAIRLHPRLTEYQKDEVIEELLYRLSYRSPKGDKFYKMPFNYAPLPTELINKLQEVVK